MAVLAEITSEWLRILSPEEPTMAVLVARLLALIRPFRNRSLAGHIGLRGVVGLTPLVGRSGSRGAHRHPTPHFGL